MRRGSPSGVLAALAGLSCARNGTTGTPLTWSSKGPDRWIGRMLLVLPVSGNMRWCRMRVSRSFDLQGTSHPGFLSDDASWSLAWPERARARSRERSRPRLAFPSSILTSTSGDRAGWSRLRTSGARSSGACSPATSGSPTATTTQHSTFGFSAQTRSCSSIRHGGSVHGERSSAGFASVRLASSCPTAATSRLCDGCAKNGRWSGASGESADPSAN